MSDEAQNVGNPSLDLKTDWGALRTLDAEVAERVMGWTRFPEPVHRTDNRTINNVLYCPPEHPATNFGGALNCVPYYSTEIADAMKVAERLRADKWEVQITSDDESPIWYVSFDRRGMAGKLLLGEYDSNSLSEAICRAALKATECLSISNVQQPGQASKTDL